MNQIYYIVFLILLVLFLSTKSIENFDDPSTHDFASGIYRLRYFAPGGCTIVPEQAPTALCNNLAVLHEDTLKIIDPNSITNHQDTWELRQRVDKPDIYRLKPTGIIGEKGASVKINKVNFANVNDEAAYFMVLTEDYSLFGKNKPTGNILGRPFFQLDPEPIGKNLDYVAPGNSGARAYFKLDRIGPIPEPPASDEPASDEPAVADESIQDLLVNEIMSSGVTSKVIDKLRRERTQMRQPFPSNSQIREALKEFIIETYYDGDRFRNKYDIRAQMTTKRRRLLSKGYPYVVAYYILAYDFKVRSRSMN